MRHLLTRTALATVLSAMAAGGARAETTITADLTTPVKTSTANDGSPDSVVIDSSGSVTVTSGAAVTMDSDHDVDNEGALSISDADDATGILVSPGTTGDITNGGSITLDEDYTATDDDDDDDLDGPFAEGTNRNGILVSSGAAHVGDVTSSGSISVEGNQSAGIRIDAPLTGELTTSGTITVVGDESYGIKANDVSGDVWISSSISAKGADSVGVALDGDIGGALIIQSTVVATGYRYTTVPSDTSSLDDDDLLQGGPAVRISGNVADGVIFAIPPTDSDDENDDEDGDGVTDTSEGSAVVVSYGSAAAVEIGSADQATALGAVASSTTGYGLIVDGIVTGNGLYSGVDGNGIVIGGLGGTVDIAGGIAVNGTVAAYSDDSNATALRIGTGTTAGEIANTGAISASGASLEGTSARAIVIDSGGSVTSITNSGSISATASDDGTATAILDAAGTVTSIENDGKIYAGGADGDDANIALDLQANSTGVTISQLAPTDSSTTPAISGDILTGSGNDLLSVSAGTITGNVSLGAGDDAVQLSGDTVMTGDLSFGAGSSTLSLADTSSLVGDVDFAGGSGTLAIDGGASLTGELLNSGAVDVTIGEGTLGLTNSGTVNLASLTAGESSVIAVTVNGADGTSTVYDVAGPVSFAEGSQVKVAFSQVTGSEGEYVFVRAGSLSGSPMLDVDASLIPFMYKGAVSSDTTAGTVTLDVTRKTTTELGLNGSQSRAYDAIYAALDNDAGVAGSFLSITDGDSFRSSVRRMLPEHAGGTFEAVTGGSRAISRFLADPSPAMENVGNMSVWLQQVAWGGSKSIGDTSSYTVDGWGASGGVETGSSVGRLGLSLAYLHGTDTEGGTGNSVASSQYELGAHWRGGQGPLRGYARVSAARVHFSGTRTFSGLDGTEEVVRTARGKWNGTLYSAAGGVTYQMQFGRFSLRPLAGIDYYRLREDDYAETGGGDAFNLTVSSRTSDELAATGSLSAGYDLAGGSDPENGWLRVELEGGRREILSGSLGDTVAHFKDGDDFRLVAEDRKSGWTGRLRLVGGSDAFRAGGEFSAEEQQDHVALSFRASLTFGI